MNNKIKLFISQLVVDAECDLGTEYCQVMKLVYDETIT